MAKASKFECRQIQFHHSGQNVSAKMEDEILNQDLFEIKLPLQKLHLILAQ